MKLTKEFIECYQYFNVYDITEKINNLSDEERYLLLICSLDNHDEEQPTVITNFTPYEKELQEIMDLHEGVEFESEPLKNLKDLTGDKHLSIKDIKLPEIYTLAEARDIKIENILEKNK